MSCPNLMTVRAKGLYHLLKEVEQLKHSSSTKRDAINKVTTKYKKQCQMLQSQRQKKHQRQIIVTKC